MELDDRVAVQADVAVEEWPLREPFHFNGHVFQTYRVARVMLSDGIHRGQGEAAGIYYRDDTPDSVPSVVAAIADRLAAGITQAELQELLPPGGARNAVDCALWDLRARQQGRSVLQLCELDDPARALVTTFTVGNDTPEAMAAVALRYKEARAIKLKLRGDGEDADRVRAVRVSCPTVVLMVDANQALSLDSLRALLPALIECGVTLLEQPFPADPEHDALLSSLSLPPPLLLALDESAQTTADLARLRGIPQVVNVKLDKAGGLTEALRMVIEARRQGMQAMVGNMGGTSLAMAPALVVGQLCDVVDLDGPVFLREDRRDTVRYEEGLIRMPYPFWGGIQTL